MVGSLRSATFGACLVLVSGCPGAEPKSSVGVFMDFDAALPTSLALDAMKREVQSLLKPSGVAIDWRWLKENRGTETFPGLVVVRFKGRCAVGGWGDEAPAAGKSFTLGTTLVERGSVMPFTEVQCEQVRKTLPYADAGTCEQERQSALGRAMGRVLAHELYHALARTTEHAATGLAKASQSLRDLVVGPLGFGRDATDAIRQSVNETGAFSLK